LPVERKTRKPFDVDRYLVLLNKACQTYYGVAGRFYLRCLVNELATDPNSLKAFLRKQMDTFQDKVANDSEVDNRIRRRFAGLYAAGQLGLRYGVLHPRCDWFMDAIASCYWAAIGLDSDSSLTTAEAIACLAKFMKDNCDQLPAIKGNGAITEESYQQTVGLRPDPARHGKRVWVKSAVLRKSVFPTGAFESAVAKLVKSGVIVPSNKGLVARQQRVPGLNIKEYFYVVDSQKLHELNKDKDRN
jgi:hypothetical protein